MGLRSAEADRQEFLAAAGKLLTSLEETDRQLAQHLSEISRQRAEVASDIDQARDTIRKNVERSFGMSNEEKTN